MQKKFFRGVFFFLLLNLLIKPIWVFAIDLQVQNRLGAEVYGQYFALMNFALIFAILLDGGINLANNRKVAGDPETIRAFFPSLVMLRALLLLIYMLVILLTGYILGYSMVMLKWLAWLGVNHFLLTSILFLRSYVGGLQWFKADAMLSVSDKMFTIIICVFLLYTPFITESFSIEWFIGAQTLGYAIALFMGILILRKKLPALSWRFKPDLIRARFRDSLPYAALVLLMGLYTRIDAVMLERMSGEFHSGIYAAAFRLLDIFNQLGFLVGGILLPLFAAKIAATQWLGSLVRSSFNFMLTASLSIAIIAIFYSEPLMSLFYWEHSGQISKVFMWLIASLPAFYLGYIFGSLLTAGGQAILLSKIAVFGLLINIGLNVLLIPMYQESGAAFATLCTQFGVVGVQMFIAIRRYKVRFAFKQFVALSLFILLLSTGCGLLRMYLNNWMWGITFSAVLALGAGVLLKLLKPGALRGMLSR